MMHAGCSTMEGIKMIPCHASRDYFRLLSPSCSIYFNYCKTDTRAFLSRGIFIIAGKNSPFMRHTALYGNASSSCSPSRFSTPYLRQSARGINMWLLSIGTAGVFVSFFLEWRHRFRHFIRENYGSVINLPNGPMNYTIWRGNSLEDSMSVSNERADAISEANSASSVSFSHLHDAEEVAIYFHSSPGGCDQYPAFGMYLGNMPVICPSRPGYLSTPLATGKSILEQSIAIEQLVDRIIPRELRKPLNLIAMGSGAPYALLFSSRNQSQVKSLTLIEPVTRALSVDSKAVENSLKAWNYHSKIGIDLVEYFSYILLKYATPNYVSLILSQQLDLGNSVSKKEKDEILIEALYSMTASKSEMLKRIPAMMGYHPLSLKLEGYLQDLKNISGLEGFYSRDQDDFLKSISVPTLLLHSKNDAVFNYDEFSVYAAGLLRDVELHILESAPHMVFLTKGAEVEQKIMNFYEGLRQRSACQESIDEAP